MSHSEAEEWARALRQAQEGRAGVKRRRAEWWPAEGASKGWSQSTWKGAGKVAAREGSGVCSLTQCAKGGL